MAERDTVMLDTATAARLRAWAGGWPELAAVRAWRPAMPVHLVGGVVRDLLLGRDPKDVDLVLPDSVPALARRLAGRLGGARVPLHDDPPTERIALAGGRSLDLAAYRGPDLRADLRARDFTVNALALDLAALLGTGPLALIDPTGGWADLGRGLVRIAGPTALHADPLRLLRAYRLLATLPPPLGGGHWRLTAATAAQIRHRRRTLRQPARERVAAELLLIFASPRAWTVVRAMVRAGLLAPALPPLSAGTPKTSARVPRPPITPALRSYGTTALGWLGRARRDLAGIVGPARAGWLAAALAEELSAGRPRVALLGWLALTLETAAARQLNPAATLALVGAVADALRASRREQQEARAIARALLGPDLLTPPATLAAERDRREALAALGEAAPGALLLAWARARGRPAAALCAELDRYWQVIAPLLAAPPLVDGTTLMAALGLPPGPALGRVLATLRTAQLRGEIATAAEALALAKQVRVP
jgi:tRNA nucleotidyltransferase/poly(A) polymerase